MLIARDQYGTDYPLKTNHPRKELLDYFGSQHADKIYRDTPDGPAHVGYIVRGHWLEIYNVTPWHGKRTL